MRQTSPHHPVDVPATPELSVPPGRYLVDTRHTVVHFCVRKLGLFPVHGTFTGASGTLDVPDDVQRSRLVAAVPAAAFTTRDPRRDRHVTGRAFLDATRHPTLRFESSGVRPAAGGAGWTVSGTMVVHGVAVPITFSTRVTAVNGRLTVTADTTVRRSSFGVTAYRWLASDSVHVVIDAELHRSAP
jgi:polyisoprenoid-binding protein YceI